MNCLATSSKVLLDSPLLRAAPLKATRIASMKRVAAVSSVVQASRGLATVSSNPPSSSSSTFTPNTTSPTTTIEPTSFKSPEIHPKTHNIHVATLTFTCPSSTPLALSTHIALHSAYSLGIPCSRPASLPTTKSLFTVPKSPFVHKKAQENFERKTHRRVIKVWDTNPEVLDLWFKYITKNSVQGVAVKARVNEYVGFDTFLTTEEGEKEDGKDSKPLKKQTIQEKVLELAEGVKSGLKADEKADRS